MANKDLTCLGRKTFNASTKITVTDAGTTIRYFKADGRTRVNMSSFSVIHLSGDTVFGAIDSDYCPAGEPGFELSATGVEALNDVKAVFDEITLICAAGETAEVWVQALQAPRI